MMLICTRQNLAVFCLCLLGGILRGFGGYFAHFRDFGGILVILWGLGEFWSFFGFWRYFGHFFGFQGYFGYFWVLEVFWSFLGFGGILVIFRFRGYFGHFLGFGGILVIFRF